jgi:multidrug transporter EmrE-like cation transporter
MNGFRFDCTPFLFVMSLLSALNGFGFTYFSFKSLGVINLSLYSLFSMLGGMMLPFLQGIIFFGEAVTVANLICFVLIVAALVITVERGGEKKRGGTVYYIGVFVLNGMSGVLAKIFQSAPYEAASAASYSIWSALVTVVISVGVLIVLGKRVKKPSGKAVALSSCFGILSKIGNYMLLIALAVLPASVQYPFVTGGTMIVSTVIALICRQKPSYREYISVGLSFAGVMILVFWS